MDSVWILVEGNRRFIRADADYYSVVSVHRNLEEGKRAALDLIRLYRDEYTKDADEEYNWSNPDEDFIQLLRFSFSDKDNNGPRSRRGHQWKLDQEDDEEKTSHYECEICGGKMMEMRCRGPENKKIIAKQHEALLERLAKRQKK